MEKKNISQKNHSSNNSLLSVAFDLIFRKGRSPPSCPNPDKSALCLRIQSMVPGSSDELCIQAIDRVRKLSIDSYDISVDYLQGSYGDDEQAIESAIKMLSDKNPGFSEDEYVKAFEVGMMWAGFA
ncbi:hypothetical protein KHC33_11635 [Methanospirillum sp. J.3.6.1-F.2.7.3]|uniref:Uncharacterized protein n=2 Tax=Methanospirillum purgamenti TaxID=2834276 RepID=A0A8E7AWE9_9EURY|nr:hypothetical protein [Methanospirillum sp. J.3.6.1-F.2.7.3]MDX8550355.1 hypothetical protein [Methanospirillum hungatei]QVV87985.1 hypothetical protein KHC33_11635 [Methanospirillum sp. J.3.6.1-F.2.7.3]